MDGRVSSYPNEHIPKQPGDSHDHDPIRIAIVGSILPSSTTYRSTQLTYTIPLVSLLARSPFRLYHTYYDIHTCPDHIPIASRSTLRHGSRGHSWYGVVYHLHTTWHVFPRTFQKKELRSTTNRYRHISFRTHGARDKSFRCFAQPHLQERTKSAPRPFPPSIHLSSVLSNLIWPQGVYNTPHYGEWYVLHTAL